MNKNNKLYLLGLRMAQIAGSLTAGAGCSTATQVTVVVQIDQVVQPAVAKDKDDFRESEIDPKEKRKQELREKVEAMPLPHILLYTRRMESKDLRNRVRDLEEWSWYKEALLQRATEHKDELDKMEAATRDSYRNNVWKTSIHAMNKKKKTGKKTTGKKGLPSAKSLKKAHVIGIHTGSVDITQTPAASPAHKQSPVPSPTHKNVEHDHPLRMGSMVRITTPLLHSPLPRGFFEDDDVSVPGDGAGLSVVQELSPSMASGSSNILSASVDSGNRLPGFVSISSPSESVLPA